MSTRISGLSSGMDTEQIVTDLMKVEKDRRVTPLEQDKQIYEWEQDAYQGVNNTMANFIIDTKDSLGLMGTTSTGTTYSKSTDTLTWVKSAESSQTSVATASASTSTPNGTYDFEVTDVADNVSIMSGGTITTGTAGTLEKQFTGVDGDSDGFVKFTLKTNETDAAGQEFSFDPTVDSIDDVVDEINDADIGITAYYDEKLDRVFLNTDSTGSDNYFEIVSDDDNFLTTTLQLQVDADRDGTLENINVSQQYAGQDLTYNFNGLTGLTSSTNTFSVSGITITAKDVGTTSITVDTDVDSIYGKIEEFVNSYNEMIDELNTLLTEEKYYDYPPLTDEQKEEMTDDEIENWEEKAKSGLLRNDTTISGITTDMRTALYEPVSGVDSSMDQLTEIGITTGTYSEKGKLYIDETELKEAIAKDPDSVIDLFFKSPSDAVNKDDDQLTEAEREQKYEESGLVFRVYDVMVDGMKQIVDKAGPGDDETLLRNVQSDILVDYVTGTNLKTGSVSIIDAQLASLEDRIDYQEDLLEMIEDRYWRDYTAMETAMSEMNSTSSWLSQQFASM